MATSADPGMEGLPARQTPLLLTITIGRNVPASSRLASWDNGDGQRPMRRNAWLEFIAEVRTMLMLIPGETFGPFEGTGEWEGVPEDSVTFTQFLAEGHADVAAYSEAVGNILGGYAKRYDQDAIAYAVGPALLATA